MNAAVTDPSETIPPSAGERPADRPRVWTVFVTCLVAVVVAVMLQAIVSAVLALALLAQQVPPAELPQRLISLVTWPPVFILFALVGQSAMLAAPLVAAWLSPEPMGKRLKLYRTGLPLSHYALLAVGSWAPATLGLWLASGLAQVIPPDPTAEQLFDQMTWGILPIYLLFIMLMPGLSEELLFRGYVQQRLTQRWGPVISMLISTTLFALAHVTPHAVVFAWPLGLWFGYVAWRCGSVVPTIVCHAFINGTWTIWQVGSRLLEMPSTVNDVVNIGVAVLSTVAFAASCLILRSLPDRAAVLASTDPASRGQTTGL